MPAPPDSTLSGVCRALFAFDIGSAIDLERAGRLIADPSRREAMRHSRRAPVSFAFSDPPLRVSIRAEPVELAGFRSAPVAEVVLFHFGAALVCFSFPIHATVEGLRPLAGALDQGSLLERARSLASDLLRRAGPAITSASLSPLTEDYVLWEVSVPEHGIDVLATDPAVAALLRAEHPPLSQQEAAEALSVRLSYRPDDAVLIDWNAAILVGKDNDDVRAVLEYANVELLEMRYLDRALDDAIEHWQRRGTKGWAWSSVRRDLARLQTDASLLFEGVNNTLKLVGDQYLARVYQAAARRFHLPAWDASILRKITTIESMHGRLSDHRANLRMELLEWIIILLIAFEVVRPAISWLAG